MAQLDYSLPLKVQPWEFNPGNALMDAQNIKGAQAEAQGQGIANEMNQIKLDDMSGRANALQGYREGVRSGDPNALGALDPYPDEKAAVIEAFSKLDDAKLTDAARRGLMMSEAAKAISAFPPGSRERRDMTNIQIEALRQNQVIDDKIYKQFYNNPPDDQTLGSLLNMGLTIHEFMDLRGQQAAAQTEAYRDERNFGLKVEEFNLDKEKASRDAPDTIEIYDPQTGQPMKAQWDAQQGKFVPIGGAKAPTSGVRVITNPDGTVETVIGGSGPLGTAGRNAVEGKAINAAEMGSRLAGIMESFKPEYQTLGTKLSNLRRSTQAWVSPQSLGPGDKAALTDFAKYWSQSIGNVNRLLNELSGAAVSPAEGERLKAEVPNPGTGLLDGDDPITFQAKMESVTDQTQRALARYNYYLQAGIPDNLEQIPLNNVQNIDGVWYVKDGDNVFAVGAQ